MRVASGLVALTASYRCDQNGGKQRLLAGRGRGASDLEAALKNYRIQAMLLDDGF
jgi:hypothetical protein